MTDMSQVTINTTTWKNSAETLRQIRREIFIEEQQVPESEEWDNRDTAADTNHYLIFFEDKAIGCARLLNNGHIGRLAIRKDFRNKGFGRQLLRNIVQAGLNQQYRESRDGDIFLHAQIDAIPFYQKLGFCVIGNRFIDAGIPHKTMVLEPTRDVLETLYLDDVIRLAHVQDFEFHLAQSIAYGRRSLDLFCHHLTPTIWGQAEVVRSISALARRNPHANIRLLLQDSTPIVGAHHPLLTLTQRLTSHMNLRVLDHDIRPVDSAYAIIDTRQLIYFNNENELSGFANYVAPAECRHLLDDFQRLWEHNSHTDPNLTQLFI